MKSTGWGSRVLLLSAFALFALLKSYSLRYSSGDENIYFYLATQVAEGQLPYRDFFHAHPPLHLAPLSLIYWLGGGFTALSPPTPGLPFRPGRGLLARAN
jgi:hypothetical protein